MKAKCIENKHGNTNFTSGKIYELSKSGLRCNFGGMWTHFESWNMPKSFNIGDTFEFAMCRFEIVN